MYRSSRALTLVELLAVVIILGVLMAILVPTFLNARDDAQDQSAATELVTSYHRAKAYWVDKEQFPAQGDLVTRLGTDEPGMAFTGMASLNTGAAESDGSVAVYSNGDQDVAFTALSDSGQVMYLHETSGQVSANFPVPGASSAGGGGGGGGPTPPSGETLVSYTSWTDVTAPANYDPMEPWNSDPPTETSHMTITTSDASGAGTDIFDAGTLGGSPFGLDAQGRTYVNDTSGGGGQGIVRVSADGTTQTTVVSQMCPSGGYGLPGVSPDGGTIAVVCDDGPIKTISTIDVATGTRTDLLSGTIGPSTLGSAKVQVANNGAVYVVSKNFTGSYSACPTTDGNEQFCVWRLTTSGATVIATSVLSGAQVLSGDGTTIYALGAEWYSAGSYGYWTSDGTVSVTPAAGGVSTSFPLLNGQMLCGPVGTTANLFMCSGEVVSPSGAVVTTYTLPAGKETEMWDMWSGEITSYTSSPTPLGIF